MRSYLLACLLFAACAATHIQIDPRNDTPVPAAEQEEFLPHRVWTIAWAPSVNAFIRRTGLDPLVVQAAAMEEIARLYRPFHIRIRLVEGAPGTVEATPGGSLIEVVPDSWMEGVLGTAMVDPLDLRPNENRRADNLGVFVEQILLAMPDKLEAGYFGRAIGVVTAHEIGHSLGLLHLLTTREHPYVMRPGGPILADQPLNWRYDSAVYLAYILGLRDLPQSSSTLLGAVTFLAMLPAAVARGVCVCPTH